MASIKVDQARFAAALALGGDCWVWLSGDALMAGPLAELEAQRELCRLERVRFIDLGKLETGEVAKLGAVLSATLRLANEAAARLAAPVNIIEVSEW